MLYGLLGRVVWRLAKREARRRARRLLRGRIVRGGAVALALAGVAALARAR